MSRATKSDRGFLRPPCITGLLRALLTCHQAGTRREQQLKLQELCKVWQPRDGTGRACNQCCPAAGHRTPCRTLYYFLHSGWGERLKGEHSLQKDGGVDAHFRLPRYVLHLPCEAL